MERFNDARPRLEKQYESVQYDPASGLSPEALRKEFETELRRHPGEPRILIRARLMRLICEKARIAPEKDNFFASKVDGGELFLQLRRQWGNEMWRQEFSFQADGWCSKTDLEEHACHYCVDTSHTCPDWEAILSLGFPGLKRRAEQGGDTPFHRAAAMVCEGAAILCERLGRASDNPALEALAHRPPQTLREAFQIALLYHDLQEMEGEEVRTMGWFDRLYLNFYRDDLAAGRLTRESAKELIKYFWIAFYAKWQGKRFGKNFCFGPEINELSMLALETYYELNTVDPKLSLLLTPETPQAFLELVARNIRDGRTAIVSLNYPLVVEGLIRHGRTPEDARRCIPVGCYEPAVFGREISCSGATHFFLPQAVALFLEEKGEYATFEELKQACFQRIAREIRYMEEQQRRCESIWPEINPAPLLSATLADCISKGRDITEGGAKYNSTACVVSYLPEAVDSLAAIEYLVYQEKLCTLDELRKALAADWKGYETLQLLARNRAPKWGNNDPAADRLAVELTRFVAPLINEAPNRRGGRFFASLYGQMVVERGKLIGALPDGRNAGTPVAKNLDACISMDRNGITALMESVVKLDLAAFPCGTCLDLMLHPSAVQGTDGITAIAAVIRTFIAEGGSGLQLNIFDVETLHDAQLHPENYRNLQVRVCGWNVRFTDLPPEAQQTFIDQAGAIAG